jgi:glycogen operon protein
MSNDDWKAGFAKSLSVYLNGQAIPSYGPRGEAIIDDIFLLCFNAHHETMQFRLPLQQFGERWHRVIDTGDPDLREDIDAVDAGGEIRVIDRSIVVLQLADLSRDGTPIAQKRSVLAQE